MKVAALTNGVISALLLSSAASAAPIIDQDYLAITASLGGRVSDDIKDSQSGQYAKISNDFSQSLAIAWRHSRNKEGELILSNSKHDLTMNGHKSANTQVNFTYLQFGGRILFVDDSKFSQSLGLALGGTFLLPSDSQFDSEVFFSGSISGGIRYEMSDNWALKGDLRVYSSVLQNNSKLFCSNNQCLIELDGDLYTQVEVLAGIEYKF